MSFSYTFAMMTSPVSGHGKKKINHKQHQPWKLWHVLCVSYSCGILWMLLDRPPTSSPAVLTECSESMRASLVTDLPFREGLALFKARFALQNPTMAYPDEFLACERTLSKPRYMDTFLKYVHLQDIIPIMMPEQFELQLLSECEGPQNVIDVGSHKGQSAIPLAKKGHVVFTFEKEQSSCEILREQIKAESVSDRMSVHCVAIDESRETKHYGHTGSVDVGSSSRKLLDYPKDPNSHVVSTVQLAPISDFVPVGTDILLFKTDTDGNELAVIKGSKFLLKAPNRPRFVIIEFSTRHLIAAGSQPVKILEAMSEYGYVCSHLKYYHAVRHEGPKLVTTQLDTPAFMESNDTVSVSFETVVKSVGPHDEWTYRKKVLKDEFLKVSGWTHLLCFG